MPLDYSSINRPFLLKLWDQFRSIEYSSLLFIGLSFVMLYLSSSFTIPYILDHPRFSYLESFETLFVEIQNSKSYITYITYFIVHSVWTLSLIYIVLKRRKEFRILWFLSMLVLSAVLIENFHYLGITIDHYTTELFRNIQIIRELLFLIFLFTALVVHFFIPASAQQESIFKKTFRKAQGLPFSYIKLLKRIIRTSWLSIILILFIVVILTMVAQGGTLLIDLFYNPWSILFCLLIINHLAMICSHYPTYFNIGIQNAKVQSNANRKFYQWKMDKTGFLLGTGNIYYIPVTVSEDQTYVNVTNQEKSVDPEDVYQWHVRSIGILVYTGWLYGMLSIYDRFHDSLLVPPFAISVIYGVLLILYLVHLEAKKKFIKRKIKSLLEGSGDVDTDHTELGKSIHSIKWFGLFLFVAIAFMCLATVLAYKFQWSGYSFWTVLISSVFYALAFVNFRAYRSVFAQVYGLYKSYAFGKIELKNKVVMDTFQLSTNSFKLFVGTLSNNRFYIWAMRIAGYTFLLSAVCLISLRLSGSGYELWQSINPINVALIYLVLIYSVIALGYKHWSFYAQRSNREKISGEDYTGTLSHSYSINSKELKKYISYFKIYLPCLAIFLVVLSIFSGNKGNHLHLLERVKESQSEVLGYQEYLEAFKNRICSQNDKKVYTISAYGGGLKSNLWTLLVLDSLDNSDVLSKSLSMSGVSGGAIGIANYVSLKHNGDDHNRLSQITNIGRINAVSSEINDYFTLDLFRELIPFNGDLGDDRSDYTMRRYQRLTGMDTQHVNKSCRSLWHEAYINADRRLPALLFNSTSIGTSYGLCFTLADHPSFPGAKNLLDYKNDSLSLRFYDAASTTNRFPIMSPTARIKTKGHFIDGGYFENSGLMSTHSLVNSILYSDTDISMSDSITCNIGQIEDIEHILISNSKTEYIRQVLEEWVATTSYKNIREIPINEVANKENTAVLETIIDIDKLPSYWQDKMDVKRIALPHIIRFDEVVQFLGGTPFSKTDRVDGLTLSLITMIQIKNAALVRRLENSRNYNLKRWGIVEPPLSRLLSEPAVEYMRIFVKDIKY